MRARLMPVLLWLGATAVAVAVGLSATRLVADSVTAPADLSVGMPQLPSPTSSAEPTPSATPTPPAPSGAPTGSTQEQTRTISVIGGSAALRFVDGRVEVVWATPNAGFTASIEQDPGDLEARADFRSADHRSRIKGEWSDGQPRVETEERSGG